VQRIPETLSIVRKSQRIIASAALLAIGACTGDSNTAANGENVVNIYNWADAVAPGVIETFESETGIKVNYDTYAASPAVEVKLLSGNSGYDVIFHDRLLASRLIDIGVYQKLKPELLPNLANMDPATMRRLDVYESVRGYNAPFHWGTTGFTWNVEMVRKRLPDQPMDTAAILFDPQIISKLADCGVSFHDSSTSLLPNGTRLFGPRSQCCR